MGWMEYCLFLLSILCIEIPQGTYWTWIAFKVGHVECYFCPLIGLAVWIFVFDVHELLQALVPCLITGNYSSGKSMMCYYLCLISLPVPLYGASRLHCTLLKWTNAGFSKTAGVRLLPFTRYYAQRCETSQCYDWPWATETSLDRLGSCWILPSW